ncbi:MAG: phage tail fiber protein [Plesiomonas sp.]
MATGTRAPSTIVTINLTGQTDFNIPFEYLARKFVVVTLLGLDRKVLTLNTDYRFVSKNVISLANPSPAGYTQLELRRETSATERLVDFHDGSILRAYDLNLSQIQTLHVAEEARDLTADTIGVNDAGHLDARNRKIVNLAYAQDGGDAIPLGQVLQWNDSAYNSMVRAENAAVTAEAANSSAHQAKDEAAASAQATAADRAVTQADATITTQNVVTSNTNADRSEAAQVASHTSEVNSAESARLARVEADRAKTEADKLGDWNELAGLMHVHPTNITFDKGLVVETRDDGQGLTINAGSGHSMGLRVNTSWINYGFITSFASIEEHIEDVNRAHYLTRKVFADGTTQWYRPNEYQGVTRLVGAVESCLSGTQYRRSVAYDHTNDSRNEYDYVQRHRVINEQGQLVGGREGTVTSVGSGIGMGLDPNQGFAARIRLPVDPAAQQPVRITKPNMNSLAPVEMLMPAVINRSNWGQDVWVCHYDDGYLEQGGIVSVQNNTTPVFVAFHVVANEVWNINIVAITDGPHGGVGEANSTITSFGAAGFELHSGQTKSPCRFMWSMKGKRVDSN